MIRLIYFFGKVRLKFGFDQYCRCMVIQVTQGLQCLAQKEYYCYYYQEQKIVERGIYQRTACVELYYYGCRQDFLFETEIFVSSRFWLLPDFGRNCLVGRGIRCCISVLFVKSLMSYFFATYWYNYMSLCYCGSLGRIMFIIM